MFDRFSSSARSVVFRARDSAVSEGRKSIEPSHILLALIDLHPELFERLSNHPIDLHSVQRELAEVVTPSYVSRGQAKLRFDGQSKRVMQVATREARSCWGTVGSSTTNTSSTAARRSKLLGSSLETANKNREILHMVREMDAAKKVGSRRTSSIAWAA